MFEVVTLVENKFEVVTFVENKFDAVTVPPISVVVVIFVENKFDAVTEAPINEEAVKDVALTLVATNEPPTVKFDVMIPFADVRDVAKMLLTVAFDKTAFCDVNDVFNKFGIVALTPLKFPVDIDELLRVFTKNDAAVIEPAITLSPPIFNEPAIPTPPVTTSAPFVYDVLPCVLVIVVIPEMFDAPSAENPPYIKNDPVVAFVEIVESNIIIGSLKYTLPILYLLYLNILLKREIAFKKD